MQLNNSTLNRAGKSAKKLLMSYYSVLICIFFLALAGFGIYLLYTVSYDSIIIQSPIDTSSIQSQQEKIDLQRYTTTSDLLKAKQDNTSSIPSPNQLYTN
jgi:hypothetical protein